MNNFDVSSFELPRVWAIDNKNDVLFNADGTIAFRRWNQKARAMEIHLSMSRLEAEKLLLCLQAAQQSEQADGVCPHVWDEMLVDDEAISKQVCQKCGKIRK